MCSCIHVNANAWNLFQWYEEKALMTSYQSRSWARVCVSDSWHGCCGFICVAPHMHIYVISVWEVKTTKPESWEIASAVITVAYQSGTRWHDLSKFVIFCLDSHRPQFGAIIAHEMSQSCPIMSAMTSSQKPIQWALSRKPFHSHRLWVIFDDEETIGQYKAEDYNCGNCVLV